MAKIKCLIVDDEAVARRIISKYLQDLGDFEIIASCSDALQARNLLNDQVIDLLFLDIEMPKLNGLALLKTLTDPPAVVLTTAYREYALEGYELDVLDYLLKPISFERFIKAINKFKKQQPSGSETPTPSEKSIYIKSDRKTIKLKLADILYVESMNNYIIVHTEGQKHTVYSSISSFAEELSEQFIRIHKSYLVNRSRVSAFWKEQVEIGDISLPVGRTHRNKLDLSLIHI